MTRSTSVSRPTSGSSCWSAADCVRSRRTRPACSAPAGCRSCLPCAGAFSWVVRCSSSRMAARRRPRSCRICGGKAFFLAQKPQQQVFGADVLVAQALGLFGGVGQNALALVESGRSTEVETFSARWCVVRSVCGWTRPTRATAESVRKRLVLAQKPQQQVLCLECKVIQTGWLRSVRKRSRAAPSLCSVQTSSPLRALVEASPSGRPGSLVQQRSGLPPPEHLGCQVLGNYPYLKCNPPAAVKKARGS